MQRSAGIFALLLIALKQFIPNILQKKQANERFYNCHFNNNSSALLTIISKVFRLAIINYLCAQIYEYKYAHPNDGSSNG